MDRFQAMRAFRRVVESGSFAAAARSLECSPAVVTKYVQFLERLAGTPLIARTTRRMRLTDAGTQFYEHCRRVLLDAEETLSSLRGGSRIVAGRLVVAAPMSLTLAVLAGALHAFRQRHPAIELDVHVSDELTDLVGEGVDVALRARAQLDSSSLVAVPLMTVERVVCASPGYWKRAGHPRTPADLAPLEAIPYLLDGGSGEWEFTRGGATQRIRPHGSFRANNSLVIVDALLRGKGMAVVPAAIVEPHLTAGTLEVALPDYRLAPRTLYAMHASGRQPPEKVRAFTRFLRDALARKVTAAWRQTPPR